MINKDKENIIKEIDLEIAYQESIISNNEDLLDSKHELTFDKDMYRNSIIASHNIVNGLKIARNIVLNYTH